MINGAIESADIFDVIYFMRAQLVNKVHSMTSCVNHPCACQQGVSPTPLKCNESALLKKNRFIPLLYGHISVIIPPSPLPTLYACFHLYYTCITQYYTPPLYNTYYNNFSSLPILPSRLIPISPSVTVNADLRAIVQQFLPPYYGIKFKFALIHIARVLFSNKSFHFF